MLYSHESLLDLLQKHFKQKRQINQIHSLLITSGHLFLKPSSQPSKWIKTLLYNTLIRAHLNFGNPYKSLLLFTYMLCHQAPPNNHTFPSVIKAISPGEATFVSVLCSCSNLDGGGCLYQGKQIHGYIVKNGIELTAFLGTALISMYGKTGCMDSAFEVFNGMSDKKVCTWNALMSSLACNGREQETLIMFEKMRVEGFHPNEITFVALLTACARAGLVELGLKWYQAMLPDFRVVPRMEHYGCVVDLLGRAGLLAEAEEFVKSMPFQPDATVLGALLGACRVHANVDLADAVGRRLLTLQPQHSGRYVVLSNIYAEAGKWDHASKIRKAMVDGRIRKTPAQSCVKHF
ncbi:hypothetical protein MKW92_046364 [Papaver armeniacum]|nr:hypothetical protein MKW92_046364 [Papaver armeniacum]